MKLFERIFGCKSSVTEEVSSSIAKAMLETKDAVKNMETTMKKIDAALVRDEVAGSGPTITEKRKAAMALNLCATSISRILSSNDMEVLDVEYESILNNLNLQNMIKDEALLSTFKSILDTVTFYRLQDGDRKRAEVRYRQQLNNAIWSASSQGACILFASASNPTPWAIVSGAIMAVGAFCNVKRARADATIAYDDEKWKLERSLIEQLHALRYSLFETSWRLADRYGFEDSWRLTIPQIEQYNKMLDEHDHAWRYFRLSQYQKNFEAYPYYWNELGESAFLAAIEKDRENPDPEWLVKAEAAFNSFVSKDMGLLREDMIGVAARLRLLQVKYYRNSKSWVAALGDGVELVNAIKALACSAPDLLMQGAVCLVSAYAESKEKRYLDQAVELLEMVVGQEYDIPCSSRLLSKLYLMSADYNSKYEILEKRVGEVGVVLPEDAAADRNRILENDGTAALNQLKGVVARQFDLARKMSNGGLFNGSKAEVNAKLQQFFVEQNLTLDSSVATVLLSIWQDMKQQLNNQYLVLASKFGVSEEKFALGAKRINSTIQESMKGYSGKWANYCSSKDRAIQQHRKVNRCFRKAKEDFVEDVVKVVSEAYDVGKYENIEKVKDGVSAIQRHIADVSQRYGIREDSDLESGAKDVFSMTAKISGQDAVRSWKDYKDDPDWGSRMIDAKKSFSIQVENVIEAIEVSHRLEDDLERKGQKVRVYTQGNVAALAYIPTALAWAAHRLITLNPDYEVVRYAKSVDVKYMHDDVEDPSDDKDVKEKIADEVKEVGCNFKRIFGEIFG